MRKHWHAYRLNPHNARIEYLGDLGMHDYRTDAVSAANDRWPKYMAERIVGRRPSVSIEPEGHPLVRQLLKKRPRRATSAGYRVSA